MSCLGLVNHKLQGLYLHTGADLLKLLCLLLCKQSEPFGYVNPQCLQLQQRLSDF